MIKKTLLCVLFFSLGYSSGFSENNSNEKFKSIILNRLGSKYEISSNGICVFDTKNKYNKDFYGAYFTDNLKNPCNDSNDIIFGCIKDGKEWLAFQNSQFKDSRHLCEKNGFDILLNNYANK